MVENPAEHQVGPGGLFGTNPGRQLPGTGIRGDEENLYEGVSTQGVSGTRFKDHPRPRAAPLIVALGH